MINEILRKLFDICKKIQLIFGYSFLFSSLFLLANLLSLSAWCLVIVVWFFLMVAWGCLQFVIVVFPVCCHVPSSSMSRYDTVKLTKDLYILVAY